MVTLLQWYVTYFPTNVKVVYITAEHKPLTPKELTSLLPPKEEGCLVKHCEWEAIEFKWGRFEWGRSARDVWWAPLSWENKPDIKLHWRLHIYGVPNNLAVNTHHSWWKRYGVQKVFAPWHLFLHRGEVCPLHLQPSLQQFEVMVCSFAWHMTTWVIPDPAHACLLSFPLSNDLQKNTGDSPLQYKLCRILLLDYMCQQRYCTSATWRRWDQKCQLTRCWLVGWERIGHPQGMSCHDIQPRHDLLVVLVHRNERP